MEAEEGRIRTLVQQKALVDPGFNLYLEGWQRLSSSASA
jgi:hypothetical protein